jgi:hypothetical protein
MATFFSDVTIPMVTPLAWINTALTRKVVPCKSVIMDFKGPKPQAHKAVLGSTALYTNDKGHYYVMDDYGDLEEVLLTRVIIPCDMRYERDLSVSVSIPMDNYGNSWHSMYDPLLGYTWVSSQGWETRPEFLGFESTPGTWRVELGVPLKPEKGWDILHQYTHDKMAVVRWLNLFGTPPSGEIAEMAAFEMLSGREVAAESFPLEIGSLLARGRFIHEGVDSVGLVYNQASVIRKAYVGDCDSYFDQDTGCLIASDEDTPCQDGGWDSLRKAWEYFTSPQRWNIWYTEVFVSQPQPVAVVYYGKMPRPDDLKLIREFQEFGLPVYHLDPCWEN